MNKATEISLMNQLRNHLHYTIYNDPSIVDQLISYINNDSELVVVQDTNKNQKCITMKIKKMNMKKLPKFNNDVSFYYNIIDNALFNLLSSPIIANTPTVIGIPLRDTMEYTYLMQNPSSISLLYNINIIGDISIMLYL